MNTFFSLVIRLLLISTLLSSKIAAADNPSMLLQGSLKFNPYLCVEEKDSITAQLSYPPGVSPQVGTFTWTVSAPNLAPIVEGGPGATYTTPASANTSSTINLVGIAEGIDRVTCKWNGPSGFNSPEMTCTIEVVEIISKTAVVAPADPNLGRRNVGIEEWVTFSCRKHVNGWLAGDGNPWTEKAQSFAWSAPARSGTVGITALIGTGFWVKKTMTVVAPNNLAFSSPITQIAPLGRIGTGMFLTVTVLPLNVCFNRSGIKEIANASGEQYTGYFQTTSSQWVHGPATEWADILESNEIDGGDEALFVLAQGAVPSLGNHTCTWPIPNMYRSTGTGVTFATITQVHAMAVTRLPPLPGTTTYRSQIVSTESKGGQSVSATVVVP